MYLLSVHVTTVKYACAYIWARLSDWTTNVQTGVQRFSGWLSIDDPYPNSACALDWRLVAHYAWFGDRLVTSLAVSAAVGQAVIGHSIDSERYA